MREPNISALRNIPAELKMCALFCCWKYVKNENGDMIKKPFNVLNGYGAKSNDPKTFVSYPTLLKYIPDYYKIDEITGKQVGGIGIGVFKGYSAIDIDDCINENHEISDLAKDVIDYCKSYTEYSPSGKGIRIILKTQIKYDKTKYYIHNAKHKLEIYVSGQTSKFLTLTGNKYNYDIINEVDLQPILDKYMTRDTVSSPFDPIEDALHHDTKFCELWNTVANDKIDQSSHDMTLCCKLAYYLNGDGKSIERYFKSSPYYFSKDENHKAKWSRVDYVNLTIGGAIRYTKPSIVKKTAELIYEEQPSPVYIESPKPIIEEQPKTIKKVDKDLTDTGNAYLFEEMFGDNVRYNADNKSWMVWNGKYWQFDTQGQIKNYVDRLSEKMILDVREEEDEASRKAKIKNILYVRGKYGKESLLAEANHIGRIPACNYNFDKNPYLLHCNNGVVNLETQEILPFQKEDMISCTTGHEVDLSNPPVLFVKFLHEVFENDEELIHYIQKALGYSISNCTREQCMFILYGDGNNGKSLLLEVIQECLGGYSISSRPSMLMENKWGTESVSSLEQVARLANKRFIVIQEPKMNDKFDESRVKSLTSGLEKTVARHMYGRSFEFVMAGKMWLATNYEPIIRGTDKGIWRRIRKIDVHSDFTGREDKDLKNKLMKEAPQILGWLVKGFLMYKEEGLKDTDKVQSSIAEYQEQMDVTKRWALENCEFSPEYQAPSLILFDSCKNYVRKYESYDLTLTAFGRAMGKKYKKQRVDGVTYYYGLRLKQKSSYELDVEKKNNYDSIVFDPDKV